MNLTLQHLPVWLPMRPLRRPGDRVQLYRYGDLTLTEEDQLAVAGSH